MYEHIYIATYPNILIIRSYECQLPWITRHYCPNLHLLAPEKSFEISPKSPCTFLYLSIAICYDTRSFLALECQFPWDFRLYNSFVLYVLLIWIHLCESGCRLCVLIFDYEFPICLTYIDFSSLYSSVCKLQFCRTYILVEYVIIYYWLNILSSSYHWMHYFKNYFLTRYVRKT
jgi:hypothetical protein